MTEPLELLLREDLAELAARTPEAHDLAGAAVWRAREQRRRSARWATAATLVVVLGLGGAALLVGRTPAPPTIVPPALSASTPPANPSPPAYDGVLHYRGAEVPVPKAWLGTDNLVCDTAIRDAAHIVDPQSGSSTCAPPAGLDQSRLTEVVLTPWRDGAGPDSGEHLLPDGRTELVTRVPAADLRFVVTSPDPAQARRIFDGLVVNAPVHCSGVWLTSTGGDTVQVTAGAGTGTATLAVRVGDTITAQSKGPCPSLWLGAQQPDGSPSQQLLAPRGDNAARNALVAQRPGTVRVTAMAAMCDGLGAGCFGGIADLGSVTVTVQDRGSSGRS